MTPETAIFADQVTLNSLVQNIVYASGTVGAIFVVVGLLLIDAGMVRRQNLFSTTIEKVVGFFIGFATYFVIGFALWAAQYYIMEGATMGDSIADWWLGGGMVNVYAQDVDPDVFPLLNNFQIFVFFLACFAGIINVLLHYAVSERMKASAYYITCVVATLVSSYLSFLTWGSVGPLTNPGFHDFFGVGFVYVFPAAMGIVFAWKLGARPGYFAPHPRVAGYYPPSIGLAAAGVMTIFAGIPMVILSCLFFFDPEALAVSVTMADASIGVAFNNYGLSWAGGALTGAVIAYATRKYVYLLLGPLAGYLSGASGFDVWMPWQTFLVALGAPLAAYAIYEFTYKRMIDEHKLIPLFLGAGIYGLIMVGIFKSGTPRSGYLGFDEGEFAFQHAEISLTMQLAGIGTVLALGVVTAFVLSFILDKTIGMRVDEDMQVDGLDARFWDIRTDVQTLAEIEEGAVGGAAGTPRGAPLGPDTRG